jgi:hypothetical protein
MRYIAKINGLPTYERLTKIQSNDIITLQVKKQQIFCKIIGETPTMIKVIELYTEITNKNIKFKEAPIINVVTKNYLDKRRKIYKITNIIHY